MLVYFEHNKQSEVWVLGEAAVVGYCIANIPHTSSLQPQLNPVSDVYGCYLNYQRQHSNILWIIDLGKPSPYNTVWLLCLSGNSGKNIPSIPRKFKCSKTSKNKPSQTPKPNFSTVIYKMCTKTQWEPYEHPYYHSL